MLFDFLRILNPQIYALKKGLAFILDNRLAFID